MQSILEILKRNIGLVDELQNHSFVQNNLLGVLKNIENTIPEESRYNFYRNLETFCLIFSTECHSFSLVDSPIVNLNGKMAWLVENGIKSETINFEDAFLLEMYHEFLHLASLTLVVDLENDRVRGVSGFSPIGIAEEGYFENQEKYNGLTEGFTQLLATQNTGVENNSNYEQQMCSIKKLIDVVGMDAVKKAYFDNRNGMKSIIDKLSEKSISPEFIEELENECHLENILIEKNKNSNDISLENDSRTK